MKEEKGGRFSHYLRQRRKPRAMGKTHPLAGARKGRWINKFGLKYFVPTVSSCRSSLYLVKVHK